MLAIRTLIGASVVFAMTGLGAAACSDDHTDGAPHDDGHHDDGHHDDHGDVSFCDLPTACKEIMIACHPKDLGEDGPIGDCHEVAHDSPTEASCEAAHDDCVQLCNDTPLPAGGKPYEPEDCADGGSSDHHNG